MAWKGVHGLWKSRKTPADASLPGLWMVSENRFVLKAMAIRRRPGVRGTMSGGVAPDGPRFLGPFLQRLEQFQVLLVIKQHA